MLLSREVCHLYDTTGLLAIGVQGGRPSHRAEVGRMGCGTATEISRYGDDARVNPCGLEGSKPMSKRWVVIHGADGDRRDLRA
jgi:hypothetical protein